MGRVINKALEADLLADLAADSRLNHPETLVFLPNHRACERLKRLLLPAGSRLLPTILPLGDLNELWLLEQASAAGAEVLAAYLDIPQAIDVQRAQMLLAQEMASQGWLRSEALIEQHHAAACAIWEVFEAVWSEGLELYAIERLSRGDLSEHWRERVALLRRAAQWWQEESKRQACISPAQRRCRLARWLADCWASSAPVGAVIIAGSTGTQASTLWLMQAALGLESGEVWLQGADEHWLMQHAESTETGHPQALYQRLAAKIALPDIMSSTPSERSQALMEGFRSATPVALPPSVTPVRAADEQHEAELAALIAKEALAQDPQSQVAIVLQAGAPLRRLLTALSAHGLIADSAAASDALQAPAMRLLLLIAQSAAQPSDAVTWLALMKQAGMVALAEGIEKAWLRKRLHVQPMLRRLEKWSNEPGCDPLQRAQAEQLIAALQPLARREEKALNASEIMQALEAATGDLLGRPFSVNEQRLMQQLHAAFSGLYAPLFLEDAAALLRSLLARMSLLEKGDPALRLKIYTPIEARLMQADRWILCGLNERQWPPASSDHPWLHPFLARQLNVPSEPLRRAQSAHDFMLLSGRNASVFWLYTARRGGVDALPSRYIERYEVQHEDAAHSPYAAWLKSTATALVTTPPTQPPAPTAMRADWPDRLSVSAIRMLLNHPYGFYAKYLLGLRKLDPIDRPPDSAQRGDLLHLFMEHWTNSLNDAAPIDEHTYRRCAEAVLAQESQPIVRHQWTPRLHAMAEAIIALERDRRADGRSVLAEKELQMALAGLTLYGRADRIERLPDGRFAIVDYKTGKVPSLAAIKAGTEPQLPLLAAMQQCGGEGAVKPCEELAYWKLSGVKGEVDAKKLNLDMAQIIDFYQEGCEALLDYYRRDGARFETQKLPDDEAQFDDYALLARQAISSSS